MLHPFRIAQSFRASFTAQCVQMYQIIWLVKMSFVAMVGVEAVLALAEVEEAAAVVAKNVARQTAKRRPAARGTAPIEAPAVAMPSTRAGPLSRSCVRLPSSSSKTEAKLVGYKSGSPTPGELTKPQAAAPKRSIPGAPDTTAKHRRPSKPATEGSAPPLKTRRIWLLLLLATGQALAASPTTIGDPKFGPLPLSRVPPTLITAGATDCPPWCLSRAVRSWACETLDCRPCLGACLVVEGYHSSGGQPAAGGLKDPVHSAQTPQQQRLAQEDGPMSPQLRSVLPVPKRSGNVLRANSVVLSTSGQQQLAICICAKCGSTSLFRWLYEGIYGKAFVARDPVRGPWVQNVREWEAPPKGQILHASSAGELGSNSFTIVRDPLDRYFSAWKSKIHCNRSASSLDAAAGDVADGNSIVPGLLKLARLPASKMTVVRPHGSTTAAPAVSCLSFADFALALRAVHARGAQDMLDRHLLPQTNTGCSQGAKHTIAEFEKVASVIAGRFGLREVAFPHTHAADESPALRFSRRSLESELCAIVALEYAWMEATEVYKKRCPGEQGHPPLAMRFLPPPQLDGAVKNDQEAAAERERLTSQQESWTCSPTWPPQHLYVIFTLPRSASYTVCTVIDTLADASCAHELLNKDLISRADERALLKLDPARLVQHRFEAAFADKRAAP